MQHVMEVRVKKLFGYVDHDIPIRPDGPTILTGPNGSGKTHLLRMVDEALRLDLQALNRTSFGSLEIVFKNSSVLKIERLDVDSDPVLDISLVTSTTSHTPLRIDPEQPGGKYEELPKHLLRGVGGTVRDLRTNRTFSARAARSRFGLELDPVASKVRELRPEIFELCSQVQPIMIDTKRLDTSGVDLSEARQRARHFDDQSETRAHRIREYVDRLMRDIDEARRMSVAATQSADLSFGARALEAATLTINEAELRTRYNAVVTQYEALAMNRLAVGEEPFEFPAKTTPTIRRIMKPFLDDWERRLAPLIPLNNKIDALRLILDSKFELSGKRTSMTARGMLRIVGPSGDAVQPELLSSGEQHLLALFTQLLFAAAPGSLVLIDEPEISFHVAWQHAFLNDLDTVAALSNLQVIIATHSPAIINGRWDIVEEMQLPGLQGPLARSSASEFLEADYEDND